MKSLKLWRSFSQHTYLLTRLKNTFSRCLRGCAKCTFFLESTIVMGVFSHHQQNWKIFVYRSWHDDLKYQHFHGDASCYQSKRNLSVIRSVMSLHFGKHTSLCSLWHGSIIKSHFFRNDGGGVVTVNGCAKSLNHS